MKNIIFQAVALSAISCSYVAARSIIPVQEPLSDEQPTQLKSNVGAFDVSNMNLTVFPIETMSSQEWQEHHEAVKSLIGDKSYVLLRQAEIGTKENEIFNYLDGSDLACWRYPPDPFADQRLGRLWFTSGRVFDVDAETVPNDVIAGLEKLERRENDAFFTFMDICNAKVTHGSKVDMSDAENGQEADEEKRLCSQHRLPQKSWIEIPEEYRKYELTSAQVKKEEQELDVMVTEFFAKEERRILAGESSVRNMALPSADFCKQNNG